MPLTKHTSLFARMRWLGLCSAAVRRKDGFPDLAKMRAAKAEKRAKRRKEKEEAQRQAVLTGAIENLRRQ
jgi:hypothetical protein